MVVSWGGHGAWYLCHKSGGWRGYPNPRLAALLLIGMCFKVWRVGRAITSTPNTVRCNTVYSYGAVGCCLVYFFKCTLQTSAPAIGTTSATWVVATAAANAFCWRVVGRYYYALPNVHLLCNVLPHCPMANRRRTCFYNGGYWYAVLYY